MPRHRKYHERFECYRIICLANGKSYIGIAANGVGVRWNQHKHDAIRGATTPLHRAIRRHGASQFTVEVVAVADTWDAICSIEKRAIQDFNTLARRGNGYNLSEGGEGPYGVIRSSYTKRLLSNITKTWLAEDPQRIEHLRQLAQKQMKDPKNREMSRRGAIKQWSCPALCAKSKAALENYWARDDANQLRCMNQIKVMSRPGTRENLRAKARKQMSDPANREKSRQGALKQWRNPAFRASRVGGNHPLARAVIVNGIKYVTIRAAASAKGVSTTVIRYRANRKKDGYSWAKKFGPRGYRTKMVTHYNIK